MQGTIQSQPMNSTKAQIGFGRLVASVVALAVGMTTATAVAAGNGSVGQQIGVAEASDEGQLAIKKFELAPGLSIHLFAAEPVLANPVSFSTDGQGRWYVAETFRVYTGVPDASEHLDWVEEDLACRTVEDRLALLHRKYGDHFPELTTFSERIVRIEDEDGDGVADHSTVFADGFNTPLDGIGAGVLARGTNVWFANIPNLWLLQDTNHSGVANNRKSLQYGYGVRVAYMGHDLHGLRMGPDGRLYFSIGDRGLSVKTDHGVVNNPDSGAVLRCNPDGSKLEIFATGLRNPQELAFDDHGNLFTVDNNSDAGDQARCVYLVEGGDSGWRVGFQFINTPVQRGPWMAEKIWQLRNDEQPAYSLPPLAHIASGPSGLTFSSGTGLPERYRNHFFLCDFRGTANGSGVLSFALRPKGAAFELFDQQQFLWNILSTDVELGADGSVYVLDWVTGWGKTGKGRIYQVSDPERKADPLAAETKRLLAEGMAQRDATELAKWLEFPDQRVRQEAQFALAELNEVGVLGEVAARGTNDIARLHAIWGLDQIARAKASSDAVAALLPLLGDSDAEVRAQVAKILGEQRVAGAYDGLTRLVAESNPRVQSFAAMALGKLGRPEAVPLLIALLKENADREPYLRHAAVMGLTWLGDTTSLTDALTDASSSVRLGALLALRRLGRSEVANLLDDTEPAIVLEAARAIHDQPIPGALPQLAALIFRPSSTSSPLLRRVINANFQLGTPQAAANLVRFAARSDAPDNLRVEALEAVALWPKPPNLDRLLNIYRPPAPHDLALARESVEPLLTPLLATASDPVRAAAISVIDRFGLTHFSETLLPIATNGLATPELRIAALKVLGESPEPDFIPAVRAAVASTNAELRAEGLRQLTRLAPEEAVTAIRAAGDNGSLREQQTALNALASLTNQAATILAREWAHKLAIGNVPKELQLDVIEVASRSDSPEVRAGLKTFDAARGTNPIAPFSEALFGGDAAAGRKIFFERTDASCLRCHKIGWEGGDVGPNLTGIAQRHPREYLLESMVAPNAQIAAGFESVTLTMKNGSVLAGSVKQETSDWLELNSPEEGFLNLRKTEIAGRQRGLSGMPEGFGQSLSKRDLRDLVEFLASLK